MIYIHRYGGYHAVPSDAPRDIRAELKAHKGNIFRRTDHYIRLALIGAYEVAENLANDTALFLASGEGNLAVFNRIRDQKYIEHQAPRPVDFINSLSNTAGFYVAQHLRLEGKNLFLSHHGFVSEMALLLAENELKLQKQRQILVGGVDEKLEPAAYSKKFLGICDDTELGEGSYWLLLRAQKYGALASLQTNVQELSKPELLHFLSGHDMQGVQIAFSMRCRAEEIEHYLEHTGCERFAYESRCGYYETVPFYVLADFIEREKGKLLFVDCFEARYRVITLSVFG